RYLKQYLETQNDKALPVKDLKPSETAILPKDVLFDTGSGLAIPLCRGPRLEDMKRDGATSPKLEVPEESLSAVLKSLTSLIPNSAKIAKDLGLGTIQVCYRTEILNERYELKGYGDHVHKKIFGIPAIVVEGSFVGNGESRVGSVPLFRRALHDGRETHIHSEIYSPRWKIPEKDEHPSNAPVTDLRLDDKQALEANQKEIDAVHKFNAKGPTGVQPHYWAYEGLYFTPSYTKTDEDNRKEGSWFLSGMPSALTNRWGGDSDSWRARFESDRAVEISDPNQLKISREIIDRLVEGNLSSLAKEVNIEEIRKDAEKGAGAFSGGLVEIAGARQLIVDAFAKAMGDEFQKDEELQRLLAALPGTDEIVALVVKDPAQFNAAYRRRKALDGLMHPVKALLQYVQKREFRSSHQGLSHVILKLEDLLRGYGENSDGLQVLMKPSDGVDSKTRALRNHQIREAVEQYDLTPLEIVQVGEVVSQLEAEGKSTFNLWAHYGRIRNSSAKPSKDVALAQIRREYNFELAEESRIKKLLVQTGNRGPYTKRTELR
ncbi:MAG: hypothetical protein KDD39_15270, partial [Bdellovibrionales bacterium]|nr:hypothetical protein [Bdellovibrionales bacterium]